MQKQSVLFKLLLCLFFVVIIKINSQAQTGLNFQGVARSSNNVIIASQQISLRLSILQGSATGSVEYSETRKVTTNAQGLFAVVIGDADATNTMGSFTTINWKNTPKFLKIEMDASAGNNYTTIGTTQFQYVAYAQFASSVDAENIIGVVPVARGGTGATNLTSLKTTLALDKINNTPDTDKPISTKTQSALDVKLNAADTSKYTKQTYTDAALLTKFNVADTLKYTKKSYADSSLITKLNFTDTASMLSNRIGKDTLNLSARINGKANITDLNTALLLKANTADVNTSLGLKANASEVATSLSSKVDKISGKELSTNDYSNAEKTKLAAITGTNTGDQDLSSYATNTALAFKANTTDVNTSLALKANATEVATSLANKVDKVTGKELSTNDYSNAEKTKLAAISGTNTGDQDLSSYATNTALALKANTGDVNTALALKANASEVATSLSSKVDKISGKELSTNDYSNAEKTKLAAITGTNTGDQDLSSYATNTALVLKANASDVTTSLALKENISNKSSAADLGGTSSSDILYPTQKAVKDYVTANVSSGGVTDGGITTIKLADLAVTDAKLASGINKSKVGLSNVENTALSTWAGSNNLTTVGIITSGTWSGTAIALSNGGTGATNATAARANLGLVIGTDVQAPLVAGTDYQIPLTAGTSYIVPNSSITAKTKIKITYDSKGLITAGSDATTADITPSTDRNYVTDVESGVISNTSGINTGDETISSIQSKLGITTLSGSNTGDQTNVTGNAGTATKLATARKINNVDFDGSVDITVNVDAGTLTGTSLNSIVTGSSLTSVGTLANLTVTNPIAGSITGNAATATTATTAGNITATSNTTLTSLSNLNTVGTITSGVWSGTAVAVEKGGTGATNATAARANLGLVIGANVQAPLIAGTDYQIPLTAGTSYIVPNGAITGATKTKITYDSKGLITAGADATTADIEPSTNRNYITDVQAGVISNTSGINTGDETTSSIKSKLDITTLSGSNTGDQTNITGNAATATTATTAGNITATSNTTLTSLSNLNTVGTITSGVWSGTAVAVEKGGTGATNATAARANLGLVIGANVQAPLIAGTDYQIPLTAGTNYIVPNGAITGATKTKITFDTKGLITEGVDATTADIAPSSNRNYVTDVQSGVISNTSGINTGDETTSSIKSKLDITTLSGSNTGDQTNITGNAATATTATTAGNITATNNTTLTSLSNLNTVGTITSGVWSGTTIDVAHGGTGLTAAGTAGQILTSTGSGTLTWTTNNKLLSIGDVYQGGIVAYILQAGDPGYDATIQKGLIAATSDQSTGIRWYNYIQWYNNNGTYTTTGASGTAIGTGLSNTNAIIASQGATATSYAAGLARAYAGGGYTDWYLPSKDELNKLRINRDVIGGFADDYYWSSSEYGVDGVLAWYQNFHIGADQGAINKGVSTFNVRAIRAFSAVKSIEDGGTGATTASAARINLGLEIGTNVQAPLVAGTNYLAPTGSAASLTNFPTFNQNTTGNAATATTAGNITATTNTSLTSLSNLSTVGTITSGVWSGTAVAVEKGGTGLTAAGTSGQVLTSTGSGTLTWTGTHYIGESYGGGKVFYVYDNGKHGLIAATSDQSTGIRWYGGSNTNTRARGDGVGAGLKNTAIIIANQGAVDGSAFAATVCNEYSVTETVGGITTIYGDWYLPSKHELNLLYLQKTVVGGFANNYYWSSTEYVYGSAWNQYFPNGTQNTNGKDYAGYVRAIRAF